MEWVLILLGFVVLLCVLYYFGRDTPATKADREYYKYKRWKEKEK